MASSQQVETVNTTADKAKLAASVVLVIAALVAYYLLGKQGAIAQWGGLLAGLGAAVVVFFASEPGKQLVAFGRDAWREVKKVVWPSRKEAMQMTLYVFRLCRDHGAVPVADRQDARVGVLRPDSGVEKIMTEIVESLPASPSANPDLKWYVVHAYSGMEKAVERNILERINRAGMQGKFGRILVPTEEVVEIKNGRRRRPSASFSPAMCWSRWSWTTRPGTW